MNRQFITRVSLILLTLYMDRSKIAIFDYASCGFPTSYHHGLHGSAKANSQSIGKMCKFRPHMGSKTPERISMKLGIYNYVGGMTSHANPHGAATTWVVLANTWLVSCFGFLVYFFSFYTLFLGSRPARTGGQGRSDGGYIGIYTLPKTVPENYFVH